MTLTILLSVDAIVARCGCVECDARTNEPCYSRFLQRPMVNEVHRSRRHDAAKAQPNVHRNRPFTIERAGDARIVERESQPERGRG